MSQLVEKSLYLEKLIKTIITVDPPTRDDICLSPYDAIDLVLNRICCNGFKELGLIEDFRIEFLNQIEGKKLEELLSENWNFDEMYSELKSIINKYFQRNNNN